MERVATKGVCAKEILFEVEEGVIKEVSFIKGCPGNTLGVANLIKGMDVNEAVSRLKDIDCNGRGTSCPDQLARALESYINA